MKNLSLVARLAPVAALALPVAASAQGINLNVITPYSNGIINFINGILVPVLFAVAFLYFLFGVYKYFIYSADNESEREKGKQFVLWGVIGFVTILSVWGIVNLFMTTLGLSATNAPTAPMINVPAGSYSSYPAIGGIYAQQSPSGTTYSAASPAQTQAAAQYNQAYQDMQSACTPGLFNLWNPSATTCANATDAYNTAAGIFQGATTGGPSAAFDACMSSDCLDCAPDGTCLESAPATVSGCTDPQAYNYDSYATVDDGSCEYSGAGL